MSSQSLPLHELRGLLGDDGALRLIEAFGGTAIYVPQRPNQASPLARAIGLPAARALAAHLRHTRPTDRLKVPLARDWRMAIYRGRGDSYTAIARRLGTTTETVHRRLQRAELTNRQADLFGGG